MRNNRCAKDRAKESVHKITGYSRQLSNHASSYLNLPFFPFKVSVSERKSVAVNTRSTASCSKPCNMCRTANLKANCCTSVAVHHWLYISGGTTLAVHQDSWSGQTELLARSTQVLQIGNAKESRWTHVIPLLTPTHTSPALHPTFDSRLPVGTYMPATHV